MSKYFLAILIMRTYILGEWKTLKIIAYWQEVEQRMSEQEIKLKVIEQAETIAKAICKGKDVEIRKSANGVSVAEVTKKVVAR